MESCLGRCSQRRCAASCSGCSLFGLDSEKSELHFVVICVGMLWVIQKTIWPAFAGSQQLTGIRIFRPFLDAFDSESFCSNILLDGMCHAHCIL